MLQDTSLTEDYMALSREALKPGYLLAKWQRLVGDAMCPG